MLKYTLRRFVEMLFTLFLIATATFFMLEAIPGNPLSERADRMPKQAREALYAKYGLDRPVMERYVKQMTNMMKGDFGESIVYAGQTVGKLIRTRLPVSARLGLQQMLLGVTVGLLLGILAAMKRGTVADYLVVGLTVFLISVPHLVFGLLLQKIFAGTLGWFPIIGWPEGKDLWIGGWKYKAVIAPMLIAAVGILLSIIGIFSVRTKENATVKDLLGSLAFGTNLSSVLIVAATFLILWLLQLDNWIWISCAVVVGLLVGIVIGRSTEYYTSQSYRPTQKLSESGKTGPATVIISGIGLGMLSTAIPVIAVVVGIIASFLLASGFDFSNVGMGLYGIGIAAVGMLSTLGITLATDAYGPIADNAGGNAEMAGLGAEVRKRTDALDSLGNTTAATGKGFAIGSAALTGLALLASYIEEIRIGLTRLGTVDLSMPNGDVVSTANATFVDFMNYYDVTLMNPKVLSGIFLGSMMAFLFCGLTMNAVGRAAGHMVDEVRRQFREIKGILTGEAEPDYERCVAISTKGAQREMVIPSLIAILAPIATGLIFGVTGVLGLLIGGLSTGFVLAIFMANAGGAWDNAKKYVEEGNFGGKGGEVHKATVVGDTVGDPFKDTSGPSLNILIKLMSMVAIVMAGLTVAWSLF